MTAPARRRLLVVFGTRPEAIKMAPLVLALRAVPRWETRVAVTAQHREMLDQVLQIFGLRPDYDLDLMRPGQTLQDITVGALTGLLDVLDDWTPDVVLVHGDTTTTFAAALAAFYRKVAVGHVEAGLRTYDKYAPYPEEMNRQLTGVLADYHFAPTERAAEALRRENKPPERIFITGNTVIDALKTTVRSDFHHPVLKAVGDRRMLLLTAHRRENWGAPLRRIFRAVRRIVDAFGDVAVVYPVHPNPVVREAAEAVLGDHPRMHLIPPLDVIAFHNVMARAHLILTDSGGIQEEAPSLGKPVLVLRDVTERPEGVAFGVLKLVGTDEARIEAAVRTLLTDEAAYRAMATAVNPYGDGRASERIVAALRYAFGEAPEPPPPFRPVRSRNVHR
ncbi:UDP-N-acetylglucosamine 2-epimerase (non-hydrolyzing) [Hydrogenibacillus sp. N12]|uniref:non-hydrolyzing UDP-N-acetylglucosamine 2-epimerase n=1 Tax=Hydrogenibacillus sp. N12 TaxID=2866627 RepID=UPI001C7CF5A6|nr:UDP-N-acetylglucosamine 2-epimerase (non-hydrolyzing) [Hydrogenibacillus sp. N12]QZA32959.1 UDP-N-acetylglucosamine 2-epimerase (non-hydrolyzing) [Hydrogenibacillus sp. N12]